MTKFVDLTSTMTTTATVTATQTTTQISQQIREVPVYMDGVRFDTSAVVVLVLLVFLLGGAFALSVKYNFRKSSEVHTVRKDNKEDVDARNTKVSNMKDEILAALKTVQEQAAQNQEQNIRYQIETTTELATQGKIVQALDISGRLAKIDANQAAASNASKASDQKHTAEEKSLGHRIRMIEAGHHYDSEEEPRKPTYTPRQRLTGRHKQQEAAALETKKIHDSVQIARERSDKIDRILQGKGFTTPLNSCPAADSVHNALILSARQQLTRYANGTDASQSGPKAKDLLKQATRLRAYAYSLPEERPVPDFLPIDFHDFFKAGILLAQRGIENAREQCKNCHPRTVAPQAEALKSSIVNKVEPEESLVEATAALPASPIRRTLPVISIGTSLPQAPAATPLETTSNPFSIPINHPFSFDQAAIKEQEPTAKRAAAPQKTPTAPLSFDGITPSIFKQPSAFASNPANVDIQPEQKKEPVKSFKIAAAQQPAADSVKAPDVKLAGRTVEKPSAKAPAPAVVSVKAPVANPAAESTKAPVAKPTSVPTINSINAPVLKPIAKPAAEPISASVTKPIPVPADEAHKPPSVQPNIVLPANSATVPAVTSVPVATVQAIKAPAAEPIKAPSVDRAPVPSAAKVYQKSSRTVENVHEKKQALEHGNVEKEVANGANTKPTLDLVSPKKPRPTIKLTVKASQAVIPAVDDGEKSQEGEAQSAPQSPQSPGRKPALKPKSRGAKTRTANTGPEKTVTFAKNCDL